MLLLPKQHPIHRQDYYYYFTSQSGHYPRGFLTKESMMCLDKLVISIEKHFGLISKYTIESRYLKILYSLFSKEKIHQDDIDSYIDIFLEELERDMGTSITFFPIYGIELKDMEIINLGKIKLCPFESIEEELKGKLITYLGSINDAEIEERQKKELQEYILPPYVNELCALVKSEGDYLHSQETAKSYIQSFIDILRLYIPLIYESYHGIKIGVSNNDNPRIDVIFSIKEAPPYYLFMGQEFKGRMVKFILDNRNFELMKELNFLEFIDIISKDSDSISDLERRIIASLRWISMGINDENWHDKFLKFAIGLECLLGSNRVCIIEQLAERCALIHQSDFIKRKEKYETIKSLYKIRSDIVHEGFARVEFKNVKEFQDIVINSLLGIIALRKEMGWKDFKAFESWITEQKFSF